MIEKVQLYLMDISAPLEAEMSDTPGTSPSAILRARLRGSYALSKWIRDEIPNADPDRLKLLLEIAEVAFPKICK